jgi:hypothetical protein
VKGNHPAVVANRIDAADESVPPGNTTILSQIMQAFATSLCKSRTSWFGTPIRCPCTFEKYARPKPGSVVYGKSLNPRNKRSDFHFKYCTQ